MTSKVLKTTIPSFEKMIRKIVAADKKPTAVAYKKYIDTLATVMDGTFTFMSLEGITVYRDIFDTKAQITASSSVSIDFDTKAQITTTGAISADFDTKAQISVTGSSTVDTHDIFGDSSAVATYQLDNDVTDLGGNYDGTPSNITYAAGKFGNAALFASASDAYISTAIVGIFNSTNPFTVSFWMKSSGNTGSYGNYLFGNGDDANSNGYKIGCCIFIQTDGKLSFSRRDGSAADARIDTTSSVADGTMKHIVVMYNGTTKYIFIDKVQNVSGASSLNATNNAMKMGTYSTSADTDEYYDGLLDQVRIFNRALTQTEIDTLYLEEK